VYPETSLKDARDRRDEARKQITQGIDPCEQRKAMKAAQAERGSNSFEVVAREWYAKQAPTWATNHGDRVIARLERDMFPLPGGRPVAEITAPELLKVLRRIEERGALDTAHRAMQNCGQIFRYAIATGRAERNIAADLRGALPPVKGGHFAAVTEPSKFGELILAIDGYEGTFPVRCALRLTPLVFVRPGELRQAEWAYINLEAGEWRYRAKK
jgi:integrase